jgi:hypothetical protein
MYLRNDCKVNDLVISEKQTATAFLQVMSHACARHTQNRFTSRIKIRDNILVLDTAVICHQYNPYMMDTQLSSQNIRSTAVKIKIFQTIIISSVTEVSVLENKIIFQILLFLSTVYLTHWPKHISKCQLQFSHKLKS